jgi:methionyl-tRNA formyltransferase
MVGRKLGIRLRRCETLREVMHIHQPRHIMFDDSNEPEVQARLSNLRPDVILMAAFSRILPQPVLAIPKMGALNVHPSLLPQYRGPSPCYWVIKKGEKTTGVTVPQANERLDSGDIFLQREVGVLHNESHRALERRLAPIGAQLLLEALEMFRTGKTVRRIQDEREATYYSYPRLGTLEDGTGVVA